MLVKLIVTSFNSFILPHGQLRGTLWVLQTLTLGGPEDEERVVILCGAGKDQKNEGHRKEHRQKRRQTR